MFRKVRNDASSFYQTMKNHGMKGFTERYGTDPENAENHYRKYEEKKYGGY